MKDIKENTLGRNPVCFDKVSSMGVFVSYFVKVIMKAVVLSVR